MDQQTQIQLLRRAIDHQRASETDAATGTRRFELETYVDEARLERERKALFERLPIVVGASDQVKQPGDYITHEWSSAPLLICRQPDGTLKAFVNICRHRGARLVHEKAGHADKPFVCRYHAWSYDAAGNLRGVPCAKQFGDLVLEQNGLLGLQVFERAGLVFVVSKLEQQVPPSFGRYVEELESLGVNTFQIYGGKTVFAKLNWKMMIEANQETYHIPFLHRETAAARFAPQVSLFDTDGPNTRTVLLHRQFSPDALEENPSDWRILRHADLVYFLFPNTVVLLSEHAAHVLSAFPRAVDSSVVQGLTLIPEGKAQQLPRAYYEKYWATILEDIAVSEPIQTSATALPRMSLWLGANESLIAHFHASISAELDRLRSDTDARESLNVDELRHSGTHPRCLAAAGGRS